jgi:(p)ppGpp synthase/HD superfamily hydrolase
VNSSDEWVKLAESIARRAHGGQFRRDGVTPYVAHPADVAARLAGDPAAQAAAWLHDVLEDTDETSATLRAQGVPDDIIACVEVLTHQADVDDLTYWKSVRRHPLATRVKLADMLSNLSDHPSDNQVRKYAHGMAVLLGLDGDKVGDAPDAGPAGA